MDITSGRRVLGVVSVAAGLLTLAPLASAKVSPPVKGFAAKPVPPARALPSAPALRAGVSRPAAKGRPSRSRSFKALAPGYSASGSCDGYNATWGFTGLLNSNLAGGDTYYLRFRVYQDGVGYIQSTAWSAPQAVRAAPGFTWVNGPTLSIPRRRWVAVSMEIWSSKHAAIIDAEWLPAFSYTLADVSGAYCRTRA